MNGPELAPLSSGTRLLAARLMLAAVADRDRPSVARLLQEITDVELGRGVVRLALAALVTVEPAPGRFEAVVAELMGSGLPDTVAEVLGS